MDELIITKHAVDRYIERVQNLNPKDFPLISAKRIVIKAKLKMIAKTYKEFDNRNGYYKLEDNIYCFIRDNSIVTVVYDESEYRVFYENRKRIIKETKTNIKNRNIRISSREPVKINKRNIKLKKGNQDYVSRIEELLESIKK
jgi:hypothetical protein